MYTKTAIIAALASFAAAAPAPAVTHQPTGPIPNPNRFIGTANHNQSPIHNHEVTASGRNFYINKASGTFCPSPPIDCSNYENTTTVLDYNNTTQTLSMSAALPSGQQAFVRTDGSLGFTGPHSVSVDKGAVFGPFQYTQQTEGGTVGKLTFEERGFNACKIGHKNYAGEDIYQVYALSIASKAQYGRECIDFAMNTAIWTGKNPYEYA
ncbi:hypothetical protein BKA65DRAFT_585843 [Rhexocercosporidium sp. MPI-PUGE-AT-0058]|nr:hypothetical protein BKA65DRAFT_585843 [Rhexocercosporidium sp. MPI-PUGE-AT-0058]